MFERFVWSSLKTNRAVLPIKIQLVKLDNNYIETKISQLVFLLTRVSTYRSRKLPKNAELTIRFYIEMCKQHSVKFHIFGLYVRLVLCSICVVQLDMM